MRGRRETPADDNRRTGELIDAFDNAFTGEASNGLEEDFQGVLMNGLMTDKAAAAAGNYPPAGHSYSRKG
ncbi:hypothetical protein ACIP8U_00475 [Streptomyces pseudovenezuelae]|uniref:hypothetical protein n=1 Tax=Streptomyces pseudovenezuelae TaxID=67350 RepID=UPI0037F9065D